MAFADLHEIELNQLQVKILKRMLDYALFDNPYLPVEGRGHWLDHRTGMALVRRGLLQRDGDRYAITEKGAEYCRQILRYEPIYKPLSFDNPALNAETQLKRYASTPETWANIWVWKPVYEFLAERLTANSTERWEDGGLVVDHHQYRMGEYWKAVCNLLDNERLDRYIKPTDVWAIDDDE